MPMSALAYVGDAVYELFVRRRLLERCVRTSGALHRQSVCLVKASFQAHAARTLFEHLTAAEQDIMLRGRNSDPGSCARHADPLDYRYATGLEALVGFLFLDQQEARLETIMQAVIDLAVAENVI